jgi:hypothetical protein
MRAGLLLVLWWSLRPGIAGGQVATTVAPDVATGSATVWPGMGVVTLPGGEVEATGVVGRVRHRHWWKRWLRSEILVLQTGEEVFSLIRGRNRRVVAELETQVGKAVTVRGPVIPGWERHPRRAIKVQAWRAAPASLAVGATATPSQAIASSPVVPGGPAPAR